MQTVDQKLVAEWLLNTAEWGTFDPSESNLLIARVEAVNKLLGTNLKARPMADQEVAPEFLSEPRRWVVV